MNRRTFLSASALTSAGSLLPFSATLGRSRSSRTKWHVRDSEGFDAISFLGPLSGNQLYLDYYSADVTAFAPRLPEAVRNDIPLLWNAASTDGFGLLAPNLDLVFSADGNDATIETVLAALSEGNG